MNSSDSIQLDALRSVLQRISGLARACDLKTPVAHLGRWKVRDVVAHLGGVHRWATEIVVTRSMDGSGSTKSKLDGVELCDWFDEGVHELLGQLSRASADEPCPNFNPGSDKNIGFWIRRQLHEATVHAWDIERALGDTTVIDPAIAADGVDEFLDVFVRTRGKQTLTGPLVLTTTQPAQSWTLTLAAKPGRVDIEPGRSSEVETELSTTSEKLLLALWGRHRFDDVGFEIKGDRQTGASMFEPAES